MTVRLSGFAIAELELIADYIARDNPQRAITFVRELREKCLSLAEMPFAFPLVPRFEAYGVRHRGYGNFQIFYRVKGDPPVQIDVLHVLHGARDYASILF
ncbi:type II toxin-antitoxin system RelE/ParE family toxin [Burkholderia multivorans]|uniref:type II toxin-antitoxin system RelE/ParE family toxin n=1 Tax=Burkholderia multivorans TaxID=87883 RepID=UPI00075CD6B4|nr:type II toxin-antitoxin system RelE/ParE family toxin [Burkholderia multivorans]KVP28302.1 plasmid stabilization protein [Burkholderia multivorans]MBU9338863.1 type II toxin-antitoxin system RelE/ParE family toxin [Burkholderia multivorans]MBU9463791.1 type II toxin-antitoxin system RelE/ParE family toxin [Burkholderia multivorans]MCA8125137.1 type II toxin-antitoxin system RelE/ParE family toxin [Burkholderia multivorans]MCA8141914.1 type II toxin-antitoxin system RelE/ParE family toxin [B